MIIITEKAGTFGVFSTIDDSHIEKIVCNNGDFEIPKALIGDYQISEDDSMTEAPLPTVIDVPPFIAMWQARDIMIKYNFLDDVMLFIDNIPDPVERKRAQSKFEFSNTVERNEPLLNYVATRAGYSKSQIDDWFIEGDAL